VVDGSLVPLIGLWNQKAAGHKKQPYPCEIHDVIDARQEDHMWGAQEVEGVAVNTFLSISDITCSRIVRYIIYKCHVAYIESIKLYNTLNILSYIYGISCILIDYKPRLYLALNYNINRISISRRSY
jgi:hypothetical protein